MYTLVKYVAKTEHGYTVERQYTFDEKRKKIGHSIPGTTVVYDQNGQDLGRGIAFDALMKIDMGDYVEEAAMLMCDDDDVCDFPDSADEAEEDGYYESRSVDTVEISGGDIRVFSRKIL